MALSAPPNLRRGGVFSGSPWLRLAVAAGVLCGLAGCEVLATVEVTVEGRSGMVSVAFRLDREALGVLGPGPEGQDAAETLLQGAEVADLREAGWTFSPLQRDGFGKTTVEMSKRFDHPEHLAGIIEEVSGANGPLSGFSLRRSRSLLSTRYRIEGRLDAGALTGVENAAGLDRRLRNAGVDPVRLKQLLASRAGEGFDLRVVVDLPGGEKSNSAGRSAGRPRWQVGGEAKKAVVQASSSKTEAGRVALLGAGALLAVAAVVVLRRR